MKFYQAARLMKQKLSPTEWRTLLDTGEISDGSSLDSFCKSTDLYSFENFLGAIRQWNEGTYKVLKLVDEAGEIEKLAAQEDAEDAAQMEAEALEQQAPSCPPPQPVEVSVVSEVNQQLLREYDDA